jgi:DNA mismatch repair ATPase MutS
LSEKVVIDREELDRLVLMRMDLDRYEAQLIPDLQQEVDALRNALRRLVDAVQGTDRLSSLKATAESQHSALHDAQRLLAQPRTHLRSQAINIE